jgi:hypothetical protein
VVICATGILSAASFAATSNRGAQAQNPSIMAMPRTTRSVLSVVGAFVDTDIGLPYYWARLLQIYL